MALAVTVAGQAQADYTVRMPWGPNARAAVPATAGLTALDINGGVLTGPISFGDIAIDQVYTGWIGRIQNTGTGIATLSAPTVTGSAFSVAASGGTANCAAVASLAAGQYCNVYANFAPTSVGGPFTATYSLSSSGGQVATLSLTGNGKAITPTLGSFSVPSKNAGDAPFTLTAPTSNSPGAWTFSSSDSAVATVSGNTVTVVNSGVAAITATQAASGNYASASTTASLTVSAPAAPANMQLSAASVNFPLTGVGSVSNHSITLTNTGGTSGPVTMTGPAAPFTMTNCPSSLAPQGSCTVTFTFAPTSNIAYNGTANIAGTAVSLAGTGVYSAAGAWSTNWTSVSAPTAASYAFGTVSTTATKYLGILNTASSGALSLGFTLSGDVSQFSIDQVLKANSAAFAACNSGGVIAAGGQTSTPCLADAKGQNKPSIYFQIRFTPTAPGSYSVTVTPTTDNATTSPGAITFTGSK